MAQPAPVSWQHRGVPDPVVSEAPAASVSGESRASGRGSLNKTVRDIALSMGLIAGIIFLVLLVSWRPQPDPVRVVDAAPVAQRAAASADFPVLSPRVEDGWRATSARFEPTGESDSLPVWFNGWVTPQDGYVAVVQSANTTDSFIDEQTSDAQPAPDVAAPAGWDAVISASSGQRSFVRVEEGSTTIVTGSLDWADLEAFRASLRPVD